MKASYELAIAVTLVAAFASSSASAQQKVEIKGQSSKIKLSQVVSGYLSDLNGKYQLRVGETTYQPGGSVGPHHHAGPGIRCITSGELTNTEESGKTIILKAGDCFFESGNVSHNTRNATDKPIVLLNFEILQASLQGGSIMPVPPPR